MRNSSSPDDDALRIGPPQRIDRLWAWMEGRPFRRVAVAVAAFLVLFSALFASWIGVALLRRSTDRNAAAVALLYVLVPFIAVVLLFVIQRMAYRLLWNQARALARGEWRPADPVPSPGPRTTPPAPPVPWPWSLRARHALLYVLTIAGLLYGFMPYEHQVELLRAIWRLGSGTATRRQLPVLLFGYLPLAVFGLLAVVLTHRQRGRREAGLLDARERLVLQAEINWLCAFAMAATMAILLLQFVGQLIVAKL
ncbi:hypothetical protein [uncultured Pseudacidovorax sp.]|uniref:hypothetical protein n=1 Tax=uncultured Pseudacidovorax sp. TaxID=679313 RepID=UPI0025CF200C|nr:hypothetical protein [uncultured Pseudacidovorax sp.]